MDLSISITVSSFVERAYAVWHQGVYADVEKDIVDKNGNLIESLKNFLNKRYRRTPTDLYLNGTYYKAHDTLDKLDILRQGGFAPDAFMPFSSGRNSGETLKRDESDYRIVWRVEPDGSTRGFFICND
ncbi:MAG: hypothetical protein HY887_08920 [Deltaproteobacteria bacterium]|nr:hypothetical protein [Deltaproteobacteria bacterium]